MEEQRTSRWANILQCILNNLLMVLLVFGVAMGCVFGIVIRANTEPLSKREGTYLGLPGEVLIRVLKCAATPLILSCIIVALGALDMTVSKTLGWQLVVYVFSTKILVSIIGLVFAIIINPGTEEETAEEEGEKQLSEEGTLMDIFLDMFRNVIPENMVGMYLQLRQTKLIRPENNTNEDMHAWDFDVPFVDSMNVIGMVFIATVVGLSLSILEDAGKGFLVVVAEIYKVSMKVVIWILWVAPLCLFFLILAEFLKVEDFGKFFGTWGIFILALNAAYFAILVLMHPLILFLLTRTNIFKFYGDVSTALITACVTSSSMASLPVLIDGLLKNGVDARVVRFLVPIGVNLNKDGSAAFMAFSTVFIANMTNATLTLGHYFTILVLSVLGSMAAAGVPFGAAIVLIMILNGLGMDMNMVGGVIAVEWINDRTQTLVNIAGNSIHPKILEKFNKKLLDETKGREGTDERLTL